MLSQTKTQPSSKSSILEIIYSLMYEVLPNSPIKCLGVSVVHQTLTKTVFSYSQMSTRLFHIYSKSQNSMYEWCQNSTTNKQTNCSDWCFICKKTFTADVIMPLHWGCRDGSHLIGSSLERFLPRGINKASSSLICSMPALRPKTANEWMCRQVTDFPFFPPSPALLTCLLPDCWCIMKPIWFKIL